MLLRTAVCMNQERLNANKQRWEAAATAKNWKVVWNSEQEYTFPCLAIFMLTIPQENRSEDTVNGEIDFVSKNMLLRILGLSSEEIKLEFDSKATEILPETFESREV
jgi:hypothetical protein